jgi:hypothetical protein
MLLMSHEIKWHTKDAVVLARLWGDLDIEDFPEYDRLILEHIEQSDRHFIHIWVDLTEVNEFPARVWDIQKALTHISHPRTGWTILITNNRIIQFVGLMVTQVAKARFRAFSSSEEAMQFLLSVDPNLRASSI